MTVSLGGGSRGVPRGGGLGAQSLCMAPRQPHRRPRRTLCARRANFTCALREEAAPYPPAMAAPASGGGAAPGDWAVKMLGDTLLVHSDPTKPLGVPKPTAEALAGKQFVVLFFSASWCPPCKKFSSFLGIVYEDMIESAEKNEVEVGAPPFCARAAGRRPPRAQTASPARCCPPPTTPHARAAHPHAPRGTPGRWC